MIHTTPVLDHGFVTLRNIAGPLGVIMGLMSLNQ